MLTKACRNCGREFKVAPSGYNKEHHCSVTCRNDVKYRFWSKVQKDDGCWTWLAYRDESGYGRFWFNSKWVGAHRVAYQLTNGPIADGLDVMHLCDNPSCVRPDHLQLGTHEDNMHDMYHKQRRPTRHGEAHQNAKLNQAQIDEIRQRYANGGITLKALAQEYGVDTALVHRIVHFKAWAKSSNAGLALEAKRLLAVQP